MLGGEDVGGRQGRVSSLCGCGNSNLRILIIFFSDNICKGDKLTVTWLLG